MSLSPQFLDELRGRTLISSVIGKQVKLTRAGREWKACCPFHKEKTPSFTVNDEKGFYHCFGCGAHGDAIRFLTDAQGLPFMDAVKELADKAGLEVPAADPRAREKADKAAGLYDVMTAASRWLEEQLAGLEGAAARDYLKRRGITDVTRARFNFGFAPDSRTKLKTALKEFGVEKLVECGLLIQPEESGKEPYDRFRGRLMIPIRDQRGRVIAFGGRILGDGEPKYLNSPETPLFDKGRTLYNLDRASPASRDAKRVVVVEGYMDVIALDQTGIGEGVAPLGTALTEGQLERLWRLAATPLLCFDGDAAGQKAAVRAALRALPHVGPGRSLGFVTLPTGQDPDDLLRAKGRSALEDLLGAPESLVDRLWRHESAAEPLDTPEQKAGLKRRLLDHVATIADPDVRDQYRSALMDRFYALTRPPRREWTPNRPVGRSVFQGRYAPPRPASQQAKAVSATGLAPHESRAILAGLMRFPAILSSHAETIAALPFPSGQPLRLRDVLIDCALSHGELDPDRLNTILADKGVAAVVEQLRLTQGLGFSFTRRDADPERACRELVLVIETLAARPALDAALAAATARLEEDGDEAAFMEQQRLRTARDEVNGRLAALMENAAGDA
ncbi:DNA primase [Allosphingosinicella vermicomposti]|uniref:DNA primase n=1 Tax=Allosphingosinicella vermicomposti TaxID=614671 RepID=UPI000D1019DA|nr:DNA primase [Allosphingosinicella vermicomposti]